MMIGPIISAGANLLSGLFSSKATEKANEANAAQAQQNVALQKQFAQEGIRWKVADAKAAGIHPLYALGASTTSFSPVSVGAVPNTGLAAGMANAGQDLSRAFQATRTGPERLEAQAATRLQLEGLALDNDIKRATYASTVQRLTQNSNPPIPTLGPFTVPEKSKAEERQPLMLDGSRILTDPGTSPGNAWEDQLGDDVFSPGFVPNLIGMIRRNTAGMSFTDVLRAIDRKTSMGSVSLPSAKKQRQMGVPSNYW